MAEYIEREAVINRLMKVCMADDIYGMGIQRGVDHAVDIVNEAPSADVASVVHGRWSVLMVNGLAMGVNCSECHTTWDADSNYCPNCGAKMDATDINVGDKEGG